LRQVGPAPVTTVDEVVAGRFAATTEVTPMTCDDAMTTELANRDLEDASGSGGFPWGRLGDAGKKAAEQLRRAAANAPKIPLSGADPGAHPILRKIAPDETGGGGGGDDGGDE
jgi:hypothetical protein